MGHFLLLWQYDGDLIYMGTKGVPCALSLEKLLGLYGPLAVLLFFVHKGITMYVNNLWAGLAIGTFLLLIYLWFIAQVEKKELVKLPVVGKYFRVRSEVLGERREV